MKNNVTFRLVSPNNKVSGLTLDYSNAIFPNRRFRYGTGIHVPVKDWNKRTQRINLEYALEKEAEYRKKNKLIEMLEAKVISYMAENGKAATKEGLKAYLDSETTPAKGNKETPFYKWATQEINNDPKVTYNTKTSKLQTVNVVKEYQGRGLTLSNMNRDFYNRFHAWMVKRKYSENTMWKHTKNMKSLLKVAEDKYDLRVSADYRKGFFFQMQPGAADTIALTEEQINALEAVDLSNSHNGLREARDLWMLAYLTGFRFSDCIDFDPKTDIRTINGREFIGKEQVKTKNHVFVPVRDRVKPYLYKHTLSNPEANRHIKQVAKMSDNEELKSIADEIHFHTARRSFCTNAYRAGVPVEDIMRLSGHKKLADFLRYIKVSPEEYALKTAMNPYFN